MPKVRLPILIFILMFLSSFIVKAQELECISQNAEYWSYFTYTYKNSGEYDRALQTYDCWDVTGEANEALLAEIHLILKSRNLYCNTMLFSILLTIINFNLIKV